MKYIVQIEAEELGPISSDVLLKWVENGRVLPATQVRNSMINKWHRAEEYDFLAESFLKQSTDLGQNENSSHDDKKGLLKKSLRTVKEENNVDGEDNLTSYKNPFLPDPSPISLRVFAALFDYILIFGVISCFFIIASFVGVISNFNINLLFYLFFFVSFTFWISYFSFCFGVFAQTFGMWFWGTLLIRNGDDAKPVYLGRAFWYTVLMLILGIFSPFFIYISGRKRALHDIFSSTQVVRISARLK